MNRLYSTPAREPARVAARPVPPLLPRRQSLLRQWRQSAADRRCCCMDRVNLVEHRGSSVWARMGSKILARILIPCGEMPASPLAPTLRRRNSRLHGPRSSSSLGLWELPQRDRRTLSDPAPALCHREVWCGERTGNWRGQESPATDVRPMFDHVSNKTVVIIPVFLYVRVPSLQT